MPGDRVQVGQGWFSARTWNRFVDVLNWWERNGYGGSPIHTVPAAHTDVIQVRNDTGANRRAGDVVGIGAKLLTDLTADNLWFKGETHALTHSTLGVLIDTIPEDEIGRCQLSGVCLAYVNFAATTDKWIKPSYGNHVFASNSGGGGLGRVITAPTSTSEQLVAVLIDQSMPTLRWGQTAEAIDGATYAAGEITPGLGNVNLWERGTAGKLVVTSGPTVVEVRNYAPEAYAADLLVAMLPDDDYVLAIVNGFCTDGFA